MNEYKSSRNSFRKKRGKKPKGFDFMKKNRAMRTACLLLVACLLSCSMMGATLAKYTTQDAASDNARVAKWGVALQVIGNLYGESYQDKIVANDADGIAVQSINYADDKDFVVAPGTEVEEGFHISLTGTPEVATQTHVKIEAQNIFLKPNEYGLMVEVPEGAVDAENFEYLGDLYVEDGGSYTLAEEFADGATYFTLEDEVNTSDLGIYYPVVYKLEGDTTYTGDDSKDTINEMAAQIAALFGSATPSVDNSTNTTTYVVTSDIKPVNTNLDTEFKADDLKITWAWAFNGETSGDSASVEDKADTILGLLMNRPENGHDKDKEGNPETLDGTVVMKSGESYVAPVEHTDFCLDTSFSIDITVDQMDQMA